jgi:hypothetical protein
VGDYSLNFMFRLKSCHQKWKWSQGEISKAGWDLKSRLLWHFKSQLWEVQTNKVNSIDICTCICKEWACTINWHRQIWVNCDWYARIIVYVAV